MSRDQLEINNSQNPQQSSGTKESLKSKTAEYNSIIISSPQKPQIVYTIKAVLIISISAERIINMFIIKSFENYWPHDAGQCSSIPSNVLSGTNLILPLNTITIIRIRKTLSCLDKIKHPTFPTFK